MRSAALSALLRTGRIHPAREPSPGPAALCFAALAGRVVQLSADGASAVLTVATGLVFQAQQAAEPVAWIAGGSLFYPPDVAARGVDLGALVVIRLSADITDLLRAADLLLRSGAFGLIVLDLEHAARPPLAAQHRLAALAQTHDTLLLCLTVKDATASSLGSWVSLHAVAARRARPGGRFDCEVHVLKDKRRGPGWLHREEGLRGPPGLC